MMRCFIFPTLATKHTPIRCLQVAALCAALSGLTVPLLASTTTTTALVVSPSTVAAGKPAKLVARVTDASKNAVFPGTVTFYDGTRLLGAAQIVTRTGGSFAQGTATFSTASFHAGSNSITAVFAGTTPVTPSTSASQTLNVTGGNKTQTILDVTGKEGNHQLTATFQSYGLLQSRPTGNMDFLDDTTGILLGAVPFYEKGFTTNLVPSSTPEVGYQPGGVVAGDFNGDGYLDLATSNDTGTISVLIGNGDGTFKPEVRYAAGAFPANIYTGDFDDDGKLDLAVVNYSDVAVGILLGNGNGTFQPQVEDGSVDGAVDAKIADFQEPVH